MVCPSCHYENLPAAKFCAQCAAKLRAVCPQCGTEMPPTARFCHECAAPLTGLASPPPSPPPTLQEQFQTLQQTMPAAFRERVLTPVEGENRLVTVLFADMSDSVKTTGSLHPEDAAALVNRLLNAMVDALLQYEGRVDRFLGDGVLAVFGVPQTHESDPERAILAALEIRAAAQQLDLEVTAGINTGEVYVGGMGSERHQEVTVMGPVVNLASRLQGQAEPGQILVGETTYHLTRRAFAFSPLSLTLKGLDQPVTAYTVERALPRPEKTRGIEGLRAELIGRDEEFTRLKEALAEVLAGRGQMVSLIGEAGVGKSRLVAELRQGTGDRVQGIGSDGSPPTPYALHPIPLWLEGRCLELGMTASYWLFVDLFRDHFAWRPEEDDRARGERLAAALKLLAAQGALSAQRVEEMGPLLGNLLSLRFGTEWDERLQNAGPEQVRHQTFLAVRDFFAALAERQPVILVLEDLHWADSLSLDLISVLMETLTRDSLLLLCVYRPEREHKCWRLGSIAAQKCAGRYTELHLRDLSPQQSRRLVESLLTIENLPAAVKDLILEKSRGNPFFVEEVVRSLIASGMVYQENDVWRAREGIEHLTVPESVQSVIMSRVDRLEREAKQVLENASVIGRLFRRRLLEQMTRQEVELERALGELEEQALIYQERVVPEEEFSFKHVLTQETVYGSILRRRRAVFHQRVAETMEALYAESLEEYYELLAYHYERSGVDEKAIEYLLKAGEKARRAYLNEEAIGYFQRALQRLEQSSLAETRKEWRLEALRGLGQIYHGAGKLAEAEANVREAIRLGRELGLPAPQMARLFWWLGDVLWWQGQYAEMVTLGAEGLALLGEEAETLEAVLMLDTIAAGHMSLGNSEQQKEFTQRTARLIPNLPYSEEVMPAYTRIVGLYHWWYRDLAGGRPWVEQLRTRAEQHHDLRGVCAAEICAAGIARGTGDLRGSLRHCQQALEFARQAADVRHQRDCLDSMIDICLRLGHLREAAEHAEAGFKVAEALGTRRYLGLAYGDLGRVALCRGDGDAAVEPLTRAVELFHEADPSSLGYAHWLGWATGLLGEAYLTQGMRPEAVRHLTEAARLSGHVWPRQLGWLEEAWDDPSAFREFCRQFAARHPEVVQSGFAQWHLDAAETHPFPRAEFHDDFVAALSSDWVWHDPSQDCSFTLQSGLEIHAANGREFGHLNLTAPRLLRPASGDFAVQTVCVPVSTEQPAIGGLLLWKDQDSFLHLERGTTGRQDVAFGGRLRNARYLFGRGRLASERLFLRLERLGSQVTALCSPDGQTWFTVGHTDFPVEDPVEVGLHAIGTIDRIIHHGAYPEGSAIRFESFEVWGP